MKIRHGLAKTWGGHPVPGVSLDDRPTHVGPVVPQPTEWQRIGNQINAAFIFARADFVSVLSKGHPALDFPHCLSSDGYEKSTKRRLSTSDFITYVAKCGCC